MLDPLGPPPLWLQEAVKPWAEWLDLPSMPAHVHEIILAFVFYQVVHSVLSPWLSPILCPKSYPKLNPRTRLNWDIHVVSLVQSVLINVLALWVMFTDEERKSMNVGERVYGYTGACGLIQALAAGYFIYDLIVSTLYIKMFGVGMLFHAISALWVFSLGFRPFLNFYASNFILYELSSPFLNIHWFFDKVNMTGSKAQWYNGMLLLFTFFSCRLVWGTWQSACVYYDMWVALQQKWTASASSLLDPVDITASVFKLENGSLCLDETCARANAEISKYAKFTAGGVPTWLVVTYVSSNIVLNSLNYYWFSKMIETVMKRFRAPPAPEEKKKKVQDVQKFTEEVVLEAAAKLEQEEGTLFLGDEADEKIASAVGAAVADKLRRRNVEQRS
ncbi:hypothetical protein ASPZODRAFT_63333 [Penicilliopsis zonata CBS 506.65]|uniref:TLC domain-containing protein n=1 Tax=Penicilliopsis zonata CBS 506.65 TaxID=1073090 RepID=A0A1L9SKF4_9EURO|nr:hypothetical protein ASPZODRAFT_63333 [Penicilliopsis zonata CBS 506.65]OJJ47581.1 hypothetical protein ASPZODRAFT_63333 [Penicilliopsis zonata CBS 506.65]